VTRTGKRLARAGIEVVLVAAVSLGFAVGVEAYVVKPYRIPSGSMEPTLGIGQHILVERLANTPHIGDIVVFHPPKNYGNGCADPAQGGDEGGANAGQACDVAQRQESALTFVKRVVGLPGDHLRIVGGHVYRNGHRERDGYIDRCAQGDPCDFPQPIVVPKGDYYMMGDNRGQSDDSRFWGPVPRAWIIGKAFFTYWPPSRIGFF
jgi:signal peptidase I